MILSENRYGKQRVRVLKLLRGPSQHEVKELTVSVLLHGDFTAAHYGGDNSAVVPTDTVKNTIHLLARDGLGTCNEHFALALADHFLKRYPHIISVEIDLLERVWQRMVIDGMPHPHSFVDRDQGKPLVSLSKDREGFSLWSGITDLIVMKTTESEFAGFPKCENTTLKETWDRIVATSIFARWKFTSTEVDFIALNSKILDTMMGVFAKEYSPSVQRTLFQMGEAALQAVPAISQVEMKLPNKHYLGIDMTPFGRENANDTFLPTDEPHGQIEAVVTRGASA